jgi:uncharacterized protein YaaQ
MKLIWAIVQNEDAGQVTEALIRQEFRLTRIDTAGGFLRQGNATLILAVEDDQVDNVLSIMGERCRERPKTVNSFRLDILALFPQQPVQVQVGGATIFIADLVDYRRF